MSNVVVTQNKDISPAVSEALGHIPELPGLITGKVVAVKPNETYANEKDSTGVTQPDTLRAVLRAIKVHKPKQLYVTGGSGAGETDEIMRVCGMMKVVEEEGATFFDHNRGPFQEVALVYAPDVEVAGPQKSVMVNPQVLKYETLISLSQLKLHETATVTLALKNIAMSFPAADYYGHPRGTQKHQNSFFADMHSFIAAMAKRFRISLAITAGHPAMIATGPLNGHPVETGLVIASTDALAADVVGAKLLGFNVQGVRHLWEAARLNLGESAIEKMNFPAMQMREAIEAFTLAAYGQKLTFEHA